MTGKLLTLPQNVVSFAAFLAKRERQERDAELCAQMNEAVADIKAIAERDDGWRVPSDTEVQFDG